MTDMCLFLQMSIIYSCGNKITRNCCVIVIFDNVLRHSRIQLSTYLFFL